MARTNFNVGIGNNVNTPKLFDRRRSFKDIQGVILKMMKPELLKAVISSEVRVEQKMNHQKSSSSSGPSTLKTSDHHSTSLNLFPSLPAHTASNTLQSCSSPLTIFYNGSVAVFDLPKEKAENVLKFAKEEGARNSKYRDAESSSYHKLEEETRYNVSMARSISLKRFLEKRKDRIASSSPYSCPTQGSL